MDTVVGTGWALGGHCEYWQTDTNAFSKTLYLAPETRCPAAICSLGSPDCQCAAATTTATGATATIIATATQATTLVCNASGTRFEQDVCQLGAHSGAYLGKPNHCRLITTHPLRSGPRGPRGGGGIAEAKTQCSCLEMAPAIAMRSGGARPRTLSGTLSSRVATTPPAAACGGSLPTRGRSRRRSAGGSTTRLMH